MYTSIRATSKTLQEHLKQRFIADPGLGAHFDPVLGGTMIVSLVSPEEMALNNAEGLSVWLFSAIRDTDLLNSPPTRLGLHQLEPAPLPLRLRYLLTPIVRSTGNAAAETSQDILGKVLQVFHTHPVFRGVDLQDDLSGTSAELHARLEQLTLEEITRVWDALERSYELSISYEVSMVDITAESEPENFSPVDVVQPEYDLILSSNAP